MGVQVESWPMGELALVLEVLKVEDPNRVQPFKNCFTPQQKFILVQKREFLPVGAWVCEGHLGACGQCEGEGMEVLVAPQLLVESRGPRPTRSRTMSSRQTCGTTMAPDGKYPPKPQFRGLEHRGPTFKNGHQSPSISTRI